MWRGAEGVAVEGVEEGRDDNTEGEEPEEWAVEGVGPEEAGGAYDAPEDGTCVVDLMVSFVIFLILLVSWFE